MLLVGIIVESILIATTIARKSLRDAAMEVYRPLDKRRLSEARLKLSYIVGRDTEHLDEGEIVRGTVETVAENTSDGVTAPMFWALIGGAPLALLYRAINTCDSMVGYKNESLVNLAGHPPEWMMWRIGSQVRLTVLSCYVIHRKMSMGSVEDFIP